MLRLTRQPDCGTSHPRRQRPPPSAERQQVAGRSSPADTVPRSAIPKLTHKTFSARKRSDARSIIQALEAYAMTHIIDAKGNERIGDNGGRPEVDGNAWRIGPVARKR